jgi:hypothetical protein
MSTFACFDPGLQTGISIYNADGSYKFSSIIRYDKGKEFIMTLENIQKFHNVQWAIVERFEVFSGPARKHAFAVSGKVDLITEIFEQHFTIQEVQWNRPRLTPQGKKDKAGSIAQKKITNENEADAILIGYNIWHSQIALLKSDTWDAFKFLASQPAHKWPSQSETSLYTQWDNHKRELYNQPVTNGL